MNSPKNTLAFFHRRGAKRKGAAIVELAVCIPIIVLIVLGTIESASLMFLKQTLVQASYEGLKVAIKSGDPVAMEAAITNITNARRINDLTIETVPSNIASANPGDPIAITLSASSDSNSLFPIGPFKSQMILAKAVMVRESE